MEEIYFIEQLDQIKAIADPLRMRLLEAFSDGPATTKQIASRIGETPTKLYHHVDALERVGLIELVKTRQNRGTVEKYFSPVAKRFRIRRDLLSNADGDDYRRNATDIFTYALEETAQDIRESSEAGLLKGDKPGDPISFTRFQITGTKEDIAGAMERLSEVVDSIRPLRRAGGAKYGVTVAFYPMATKKRKGGNSK